MARHPSGVYPGVCPTRSGNGYGTTKHSGESQLQLSLHGATLRL